jgi:hypothetical protein
MSARTTLVVATRRRSLWNLDCVLFVGSLFGLHAGFALRDVERIIIDRSASADEFLRFLTALPAQATGDVVSLAADGGAFLSAVGRGGDRVLYLLGASDVAFYLETNRLTAPYAALVIAA